MKLYPPLNDDISIVLCGAAGQGIQTVEELATQLFQRSTFNLFCTKEYMSRVRGGSNSTEIRVSSQRVEAFLDRIDILFPLNHEALKHVEKRITPDTIIIGEKDRLIGPDDADMDIVNIPFTDMAKEIGGPIYANIIATGVIAALFAIEMDVIKEELTRRFARKGEDILTNNFRAAERGYDAGMELVRNGTVTISIHKDLNTAGDFIISGGQAVGMGALAGGCNFITSYPMTPSTTVFTFLAAQSKEFEVIVDQAEDEIEAMNMALGAWYAGARAMVATSGGGFDLMTEGLSLAGILENPIVIHLGQRPGPATGLPTRTEQADLNLALYAGHGEFPRAVFAPGSLKQAFELTAHAFDIADKYQVPAFILTDQFFIDSYYNIPRIDVSGMNIEHHIIETTADYRRYEVTENGVSPRGIPEHGAGLVVVDSDEHDVEGHITESSTVRTMMVEKRLRKNEGLIREAIAPQLFGSAESDIQIICWGSTLSVVREVAKRTGRDDITVVHFSQVFPLHHDTPSILGKSKRHIIVEQNAASQFANVLKLYAGIDMDERINKYDGLPFSVEELAGMLRDVI